MPTDPPVDTPASGSPASDDAPGAPDGPDDRVDDLPSSGTATAVVAEKIPLGSTVSGTEDPGHFWVRFPSRMGGLLLLKLTAGTPEATVQTSTGPMSVELEDFEGEGPDGEEGWKKIEITEMDAKTFREWCTVWLKVTGSTSYDVTASFVQIGHAMDKDDKPLIPWNFWYWPWSYPWAKYTHNDLHGAAESGPCKKVDAAFADKAGTCYEWERNGNHWLDKYAALTGFTPQKDPIWGERKVYTELTDDERENATVEVTVEGSARTLKKWHLPDSWHGHCDGATAAAMFFEQPVAKAVGGKSFTQEDLEYLLTEYCINRYASVSGKSYYMRSYDDAQSSMQRAHAKKGGIDPLDKIVHTFHDVLHYYLCQKKVPVIADMRGSGWSSIWNQAVYKVTFVYEESADASGTPEEKARDVTITATFRANADNSRLNNGDPESALFVEDETQYRLIFTEDGDVHAEHEKQDWIKCGQRSREGASYEELQPPRWLMALRLVAYKDLSRDRRNAGNPIVKTGDKGQVDAQVQAIFDQLGIKRKNFAGAS